MQRITIITIPANDLIDVTDFPYNNSNDMKKAEEKFGKNNKVHTILCGGKELEHILEKRHKRVKNVILQISTNHIGTRSRRHGQICDISKWPFFRLF